METGCCWMQDGDEKLEHIKSLLVSIANHLQDHLIFRKLNLDDLSKVNYLLAAKLIDWKQKRYTIYDVIETSEQASTFTIKARNCFETFSNCRSS